MHCVVKQNIHVDFVLAGAHVDMVGRDFGKFFHDTLCTDAHKLWRDCRGNENLRHFRQLFHKLLRARIYRLCAIELRIGEKLVNNIRAFAQLSPARYLV